MEGRGPEAMGNGVRIVSNSFHRSGKSKFALEATPRMTDTRYFWSGQGKRETVICHWQMRLKKVFDLAGVSKGEGNAISHRFRDTFAVELLLAGVPIERVSILLGHQSVRVTERHYNPWVRSRREQLEADVAAHGSSIRF